MSAGKFLFLGTGASSGVPVIGCHCETCDSQSPFNKRMRPSALVTMGSNRFLIDAGPDLRDQALRFHIDHLTAVLITHAHYDHIGGMDELRSYYFIEKHPVRCLLSKMTKQHLQVRYPYLFEDHQEGVSKSAKFDFHVLNDKRGLIHFHDLAIQYMTYEQSNIDVLGFRLGNLAYISDIKRYPESIFEDLSGIEILIVSALRDTSSWMHFTLEEAVAFSHKVGAKKVYFTHIAHELEHDKTNSQLPDGMQLAYDGLEINFNGN